MIYDIFTLCYELDLLEIRLNLLNDYVDYFVIIEATETFSGYEKPLYYQENKDRFKDFQDKIIHYVVTDTPKYFQDPNCDQTVLKMGRESSNVGGGLVWLKEFYQKELIKNAIVHLNDDDICFVSDVDEIWNFNILSNYKFEDDVYKPKINWCYINYLNVMTSEDWTNFTGPIVTRYKNIKNENLNHLRTQWRMVDKYIFIEDGGWHFNSLGGIQKKVDEYKHPVNTIGYMKTREKDPRIDETYLPKYILDNKEKYKNHFLQQ